MSLVEQDSMFLLEDIYSVYITGKVTHLFPTYRTTCQETIVSENVLVCATNILNLRAV